MIVAKEKELAEFLEVSGQYIREAYQDFKGAKGYDFMKVVKRHLQSVRGNSGTMVNAKTLAELLGVSDKAVRELTAQNILVKNEKDKYDLFVNIKQYIQSDDEWNRKKKAEREILEIKKEILKDKYHAAEDIELILSNVVMNFKMNLMAAKRKIIIALESAEKEKWGDILDELFAAALNEMAKYNPPTNAGKVIKDL